MKAEVLISWIIIGPFGTQYGCPPLFEISLYATLLLQKPTLAPVFTKEEIWRGFLLLGKQVTVFSLYAILTSESLYGKALFWDSEENL